MDPNFGPAYLRVTIIGYSPRVQAQMRVESTRSGSWRGTFVWGWLGELQEEPASGQSMVWQKAGSFTQHTVKGRSGALTWSFAYVRQPRRTQ